MWFSDTGGEDSDETYHLELNYSSTINFDFVRRSLLMPTFFKIEIFYLVEAPHSPQSLQYMNFTN